MTQNKKAIKDTLAGTPLSGAVLLPITAIRPNPDNPRETFDEAPLKELADSLRANGFLQPLVVRYEPSRYDGTPYTIISGSRRFYAAQRAELSEVPCVIKDVSEATARDLALVENIQRQNLQPIEEARAFERAMQEHALSLRKVAERFNKHPSYVQNRLDLLKAPRDVQDWAAQYPEKMSHALAVRAVKDKSTRAELLDMAVHGASVEEIRGIISKEQEREQARDDADTPPTAHDQQRQAIAAQSGSAPVSRGYPLTNNITPAQAQAALDRSLGELLTAARGALHVYRDWAPHGATMNHDVAIAVVNILREMGSEFVTGEVVER